MEQHLGELDRHFGPAAVLSLTQRALVPDPGRGVVVGTRPGLTERVTGAMVGMALGHAFGFPYEWEPPARRRIEGIPTGRAQQGAEVELACWSLEAVLDHDLGAASALAVRLQRAPRLQRPGNAVPATIRALRRGVPWFEAGVGSFGSGAVTRAVGVGIALRDRPEWRTVAAALDASVTHASADAAAVSSVIADTIALLLALPADADDPLAIVDELIATTPPGIGAIALQLVRYRIEADGPAPQSGAQAIDALSAALFHALRHLRDPQAGFERVLSAGGDTDTVGALVGAFVGAANGIDGFPPEWRARLTSTARLTALSARATGDAPTPVVVDPTRVEPTEGVHISFLIDRSGSMASLRSDVVGGVNAFLATHRAEPGECRLTLVQFDSEDPFEVLVHDADVHITPDLDARRYQPRGTTPLFDAIGSLLDHAEARIAGGANDDQLVVVFTDGLENASRRWTHGTIFDRVQDLQAKGWTFVFMGANQDSYAEGGRLGFSGGSVSNYDADGEGVRTAFDSLSRSSSSFRRKGRTQRVGDRLEFFEGVKEAEDYQRRKRSR